jgi:methionyl-tRNA synthetase
MPSPAKKFYLTTPIYYVNARPHIGHAYTTIAADVIARRHRLLGEDTFFLTGTDEHGQKVQRSAAAAGIPPQQFADEVSASFRNLWKRMGLLDDSLSKDDPLFHRDFIRTTEERHHRGVQHLWRQLEANGAIYLSSYTGQYCVSDEAFVDVPVGAPCPICGRPTETITEENYFFRLSDYQLPLLDLIENGALHIQPETARNEVLSFLRGGLKDLSISRTTFDWGIPVPATESVILSGAKNPRISSEAQHNPSEKHVVYVWLDALANYITAIGYGAEDRVDLTAEQKKEEQAKFKRFWPADLHLVGKEITRFHCVYWPAILLAAGLPLPKSIVANGWLLFEESKMSKSRGNIVRTETILDAFGEEVYGKQFPDSTKAERDLFAADVLRYFLLREIPFGQDGTFSFDALITRYNADLANGYGNLVSRVLRMIQVDYEGLFSKLHSMRTVMAVYFEDADEMIAYGSEGIEKLAELTARMTSEKPPYDRDLLTQFDFLRYSVDRYLSANAPWKLSRDVPEDESRRQEILYTAAESIRILTALLYPILPYATASVWCQLGLGDIEEDARNGKLKDLKWGGLKPGTKLGPLAPIFPRADKGLAQIMTEMESPTPAPAEAPSTEPQPSNLEPGTSTAPQPSNLEPGTATISIDDFAKVDLRVAQIVVAERIPKADKLLRLEVDLGPNFPRRQILAGIAEHYAPESLIGRKVVIVANLAPRKMRGLESQGMVVAASIGPAGAPVLAGFLEDVELGARLK